MKALGRTNSWHWLAMAMGASLLLGAYLFHSSWKKSFAEIGPQVEGMRRHGEALALLDESDALAAERQLAELRRRLEAYEAAVEEMGAEPVPEGEASVLRLSNEINAALQKDRLRIVEREQVSERPADPAASGAASSPMAGAAAAAAHEKTKQALPYNTREIHYVLEGEYADMFMFLVKQSHRKPPYHFKNIEILPVPDRGGMRMAFTVEIHFT